MNLTDTSGKNLLAQRFVSVKNVGSQPIPPFGVMRIGHQDGTTIVYDGWNLEEEAVIANVSIPDTYSELYQDSTVHLINGPFEIGGASAGNNRGRATQDWPATVRYTGDIANFTHGVNAVDRIGIGARLKSGQTSLELSDNPEAAYAVLGPDPATDVADTANKRCWIAGRGISRRQRYSRGMLSVEGTVAATSTASATPTAGYWFGGGALQQPLGSYNVAYLNVAALGTPVNYEQLGSTTGIAIEALISGIFAVHFHGTVSCDEPGKVITISAWKWPVTTPATIPPTNGVTDAVYGTPTPYLEGSRTQTAGSLNPNTYSQEVEIDSAENVAFTGYIDLEKNEAVEIRCAVNTGTANVTISRGRLYIERTGVLQADEFANPWSVGGQAGG